MVTRTLTWHFDYVGKQRFHKKAKVNFRIYNVINWEVNHYNTYIARYLKT